MRVRATSAIVGVLLLAGLTGCSFLAPQTNQKPYDPSDGIGVTLGRIDVRNALLISDDGKTANLSVSVINTSTAAATVQVSWKGASGTVDRNVYVKAGGTQTFGSPENQIILNGVDAKLGSLFPVYFQHGTSEGKELMVPVLDGTLQEYSTLVPVPGS